MKTRGLPPIFGQVFASALGAIQHLSHVRQRKKGYSKIWLGMIGIELLVALNYFMTECCKKRRYQAPLTKGKTEATVGVYGGGVSPHQNAMQLAGHSKALKWQNS